MSIQGYADGIEMGVFSDAKGTANLIYIYETSYNLLISVQKFVQIKIAIIVFNLIGQYNLVIS